MQSQGDEDDVAEPVLFGGPDQVAEAHQSGPTPGQDAVRILRVTLELTAVTAGLAVVVALLWVRIAPDVALQVSDGGAFLDEVQGAKVFGRDGWFAILTAAAGVLTGIYGWLRHRDDAVPLSIAAAIAGVVGAVLAWRLGIWWGPQPLEAQVAVAADGDTLTAPLGIDATGVLLAWPILSLATMLVLALLQPRPRHIPTHDRRDG